MMRALEQWYSSGAFTAEEFNALYQWREDAGRQVRRKTRIVERRRNNQPKPVDFMRASARERYSKALRAVERIDYTAADALRRLVIDDEHQQSPATIKRGVRIITTFYSGS